MKDHRNEQKSHPTLSHLLFYILLQPTLFILSQKLQFKHSFFKYCLLLLFLLNFPTFQRLVRNYPSSRLRYCLPSYCSSRFTQKSPLILFHHFSSKIYKENYPLSRRFCYRIRFVLIPFVRLQKNTFKHEVSSI